jgi:hypothetical protein
MFSTVPGSATSGWFVDGELAFSSCESRLRMAARVASREVVGPVEVGGTLCAAADAAGTAALTAEVACIVGAGVVVGVGAAAVPLAVGVIGTGVGEVGWVGPCGVVALGAPGRERLRCWWVMEEWARPESRNLK